MSIFFDKSDENTIQLDTVKEKVISDRLRAHLIRIGQQNIELNVRTRMGVDEGFLDRFLYLTPWISENSRERILISGCAVGSEMIIARKFGWKSVVGTEVDGNFVKIAAERLTELSEQTVVLYDGKKLPFRNGFFSTVFSGHIIEHTQSPYQYSCEHLRVLKMGGYLFLEFPDRYHRVELHTNMPSVEFMPLVIRKLLLRYRSSRFSKLNPTHRLYSRQILDEIHPMSVWQVKIFLFLNSLKGKKGKVEHWYSPAPGYVRMLIRAQE